MDVQVGSLDDKLPSSIYSSYQIKRTQYNEQLRRRRIRGVTLITSNPINQPSCILFFSGLCTFFVRV
jgi:hypothetical protein